MKAFVRWGLVESWFCIWLLPCAAQQLSDNQPLWIPPVGGCQMRLLAPRILELTRISSSPPGSGRSDAWDFVNAQGQCDLPGPHDFQVWSGGVSNAVEEVGFRRRVLYAPFKRRDLRIGNYLYLKLKEPVGDNQRVEVGLVGKRLGAQPSRMQCTADPQRWSPVLHVNQTGYLPALPHKALVGCFLGSLGEMDLEKELWGNLSAGPRTNADSTPGFLIVDAHSGREVYRGRLKARPESGFPMACYQRVMEADFSALTQPGEYKLLVPGLGTSFAFWLQEDVAGAFARTCALGLYHQRCGMANELPFTRFGHGACHVAAASVPDMSPAFASVNDSLAKESANFKDNPRHTAPQLKSVEASLYPFVRLGKVDVHGGHHDAGDYSKYTINSAAFIHHLVFAVDVFPGVAALDNLGLPESGDGKSDVLQEAKWEADFLTRMQDADGGFYFLVYPRDREYENDVLPDRGDPQVVFPKTTSVTAAATAALAQCAASPTFRKQFPEAALQYLGQARKGWAFLERALDRYGKNGAYQKITHYGDEFMHDDELAWAACELFLATGEPAYEKRLNEWLHPSDPDTRRWGWWRLYDSYGCAIRSYAFGARSGRLKREQLSPLLLEECEKEIAAAGQDQMLRACQSAYGTSLPEETKRTLSPGWYFSSDAAFDLAVACQLDYPASQDPRAGLREALVSNLNYEQGCNPVNVVYLTGLGWKRQREIVHQYAQNERQVLPPSGIPLGNVQSGFGWLEAYQPPLTSWSLPADSPEKSGGVGLYPFYDRWGDSFNLSQEFVILNQARELAYTSWLMAQTPLKTQPWRGAGAQLVGLPGMVSVRSQTPVSLTVSNLNPAPARIVWEASGQEPEMGRTFLFRAVQPGAAWVEAEALWPDGRRVSGVANVTVR